MHISEALAGASAIVSARHMGSHEDGHRISLTVDLAVCRHDVRVWRADSRGVAQWRSRRRLGGKPIRHGGGVQPRGGGADRGGNPENHGGALEGRRDHRAGGVHTGGGRGGAESGGRAGRFGRAHRAPADPGANPRRCERDFCGTTEGRSADCRGQFNARTRADGRYCAQPRACSDAASDAGEICSAAAIRAQSGCAVKGG